MYMFSFELYVAKELRRQHKDCVFFNVLFNACLSQF